MRDLSDLKEMIEVVQKALKKKDVESKSIDTYLSYTLVNKQYFLWVSSEGLTATTGDGESVVYVALDMSDCDKVERCVNHILDIQKTIV